MCARNRDGIRGFCSVLSLFWALFAMCSLGYAGVPRFVSGQTWGVPAGWNVTWPATTLQYFTDQGALSTYVPQAKADQMVSAAAAVWNDPTSSISLVPGGKLQEDVSTANTGFDGQDVVFPQDVQITSERAVPIAIVYDATGELIDLLLGSGASDPSGCRDNAVVGDVDDIHQNDGTLRHATLILNGRCAGPAPEQLLQMQYQLVRAFGRVLGLSWSQTNDNVFTGQTTVTANQLAYWPIMHPLDVVCGAYTYQCISNPFTLRPEDLNTLTMLYPIPLSNVPNGKRGSDDDALVLYGFLYFPSGQGMGWTNITVHRLNKGVLEDWQTASSITGYEYLQSATTPLQPTPPTTTGNATSGTEGLFFFRRIPCDGVSDLYFTSEPVNPLYVGDAAIGPYVHPPVTPSGSPVAYTDFSAFSWGDNEAGALMTAADAVPSCDATQNGTEQQPIAPDASGWQAGHLCSWNTSTWWRTSVAAGHSWTLEVTSTDETGAATNNKLQPVMGIWRSTDSAGGLPTVASQAVPFNSLSMGMTQLRMNAGAGAQTLRISLSDQFGVGRPDFSYVARFLYAADVSPAVIPSGGGRLTITGTGFQQGLRVLVNGVSATVLSLSPTQIIVNAPAMLAAGARANLALDLTLTDTRTGGTAGIARAVHYVQLPNQLVAVSTPTVLKTGIAQSLSLKLVSADGLTPIANAGLTLSVTAGQAQLGTCDGSCTLITNPEGLVQLSLTGLAAGPVTLLASQSNGPSLTLTIVDEDPTRAVSFSQGTLYVAQGATPSLQVSLQLLQEQQPIGGVAVSWSASGGVQLQQTQTSSQASGLATVALKLAPRTPAGLQTVTACAWSSVCSTWTLKVVPATEWKLAPASTAFSSTALTDAGQQLALEVTDSVGNILVGAPVYIYQRVLAAAPPCPSQDRCPTAAVLETSETIGASDGAGNVHFAPLTASGSQTLQVAAATGAAAFFTWTGQVGGAQRP